MGSPISHLHLTSSISSAVATIKSISTAFSESICSAAATEDICSVAESIFSTVVEAICFAAAGCICFAVAKSIYFVVANAQSICSAAAGCICFVATGPSTLLLLLRSHLLPLLLRPEPWGMWILMGNGDRGQNLPFAKNPHGDPRPHDSRGQGWGGAPRPYGTPLTSLFLVVIRFSLIE
ncbi:hypothetical protein SLEP1_g28283 [Rubroshorea leprosula]|uniref:Uncharacterized protein n=1 Tax=Rubroshorea leprosula TaxID=152421 RepID=A0AAV5JTA3_9ROSI|nr:hypothetical protein SLEP1_g28283 [Rubroshorea leprosula]